MAALLFSSYNFSLKDAGEPIWKKKICIYCCYYKTLYTQKRREESITEVNVSRLFWAISIGELILKFEQSAKDSWTFSNYVKEKN